MLIVMKSDATDEQVAMHRKLVSQSLKLFKSQHYDHYDFLLHLSDELGDIGRQVWRPAQQRPVAAAAQPRLSFRRGPLCRLPEPL